MDYNAIKEIEQTFCGHYFCSNCPLSKYRVGTLAICTYGAFPEQTSEEDLRRFLRIARGYWKPHWNDIVEPKTLSLLHGSGKVV